MKPNHRPSPRPIAGILFLAIFAATALALFSGCLRTYQGAPPGSSDGIGAVARDRKGASGQKTETQHLAPNERSGHDIALFLSVNAGAPIGSLESANHEITQERVWDSLRKVQLAKNDRLPNKDFVLRYRLSNTTIEPSFTAYDSHLGKYFTLTLHPPAEISDDLPEQPLEMIFVLDCSGSMNGAPISQAKSAMTRALRQLRPDDTFQIIRFSQDASQLGAKPLPATAGNVRKGLKHVAEMTGGAGTVMIEGVKAALDHNLMSAYTAFVAVDASRKTSDKEAKQVTQAIPAPEGVSYEGAVTR